MVPVYMNKEHFKFIAATHLFLIRDGKILLLRRFNTGYEDGNYSVPAGHLDGKETAMQATTREAAHVMNRVSTDGERIDFFFKTGKWTGEPKNMEPHKCDGLEWFDMDNLPQNVIPYVRQAIECVQKGIFYSEFGWNK